MKKKAKGYDCITEIFMFMLIGCALEAPPWRTIAEVARGTKHNWTTTRNVLDLLHTLGLLNREGIGLKKRYQHRQTVDKLDYLEDERLETALYTIMI